MGPVALLVSERQRRPRRLQRRLDSAHHEGAGHSLCDQAETVVGSLPRPEGREIRPYAGTGRRIPRRVWKILEKCCHTLHPKRGDTEE